MICWKLKLILIFHLEQLCAFQIYIRYYPYYSKTIIYYCKNYQLVQMYWCKLNKVSVFIMSINITWRQCKIQNLHNYYLCLKLVGMYCEGFKSPSLIVCANAHRQAIQSRCTVNAMQMFPEKTDFSPSSFNSLTKHSAIF